MATERFGIDRHQLGQLMLYSALVLGVGVVLDIVAAASHSHAPQELTDLGPSLTGAGVLMLVACAAYARAYTELTADGIKTRTFYLRTRRVAWADVKDITVHDSQDRGSKTRNFRLLTRLNAWADVKDISAHDSGDRGVYTVRVTPRSGRSFRLGAPVHNNLVMADPQFFAKAERIMDAWQRAVYGAAPGFGAAPHWGAAPGWGAPAPSPGPVLPAAPSPEGP